MPDLKEICRVARETLAENQSFPCRIDEMTDREAKIANMACDLYSTLKEIVKLLEPDEEPGV